MERYKIRTKYFSNLNEDQTITENVINYPDLKTPYTRTVETKHASGQKVNASVVAYEMSVQMINTILIQLLKEFAEKENEKLKKLYSKKFFK